MDGTAIPIDRQTWGHLLRAGRNFAHSDVGGQARWLFVGLVVMLLGINGLNVLNSYVGRDFMTAIADRRMAEFITLAILYIGVLALSTGAAVLYRFIEEKLGLLWRNCLTRRLIGAYLEHPTYYRLNDHLIANGEVANPDERITESAKAFTVTTLSFVLMILNGSLTVIAFSGVMWSISPLLFGVCLLYAAAGSFATIKLGRPLIQLQYDQLDKEANFRAGLIHVRDHAESIALDRYEKQLHGRLLRHLDELTGNFGKIIVVNRQLGFFTTGYNWLIQIIPALIVAPLYIAGEVQFGLIAQAGIAFAQLIGAFSLIVNQFQQISSFTAVVARIASLEDAIDKAQSTPLSAQEVCSHHRRTSECPVCSSHPPTAEAIEVCHEDACLGYHLLTLRAPGQQMPLVRELSLTIRPGTRVRITGPKDAAKSALFLATAGIWGTGEGRIVRPGPEQIYFLPERPYLPPARLREVLLRDGDERRIPDERIAAALDLLDLQPVVARVGGLDAEKEWNEVLSLNEQQRFAFARLLLGAPRFAMLDRPGTALGPATLARVLEALSENSITYLTFGDRDDRVEAYDAVLELAEDGSWQWVPRATRFEASADA